MLLRMIYDDMLAQAAWLLGCQRTGQAIIFDPQRDIDRYLHAAQRSGLRLVAAAETHIHADFLSGARELAERAGVRVYLSDEGGPEWKYRWLDQRSGGGRYDARLLHDGDTFEVGGIEFRALHTPGHTPEHLCYLVTDRGGGATEPMGLVSGDFVFAGDVGRPDLLESAVGQRGASEPAARQLYQSIQRFVALPEYLQVWPGHGAGSACGKALGAVPQTTVGYEKRFNAAIRAATDERRFVEFILAGQPDPPLYFGRMKRQNRDGPPLLGALPQPDVLTAARMRGLDFSQVVVIDTRPWDLFRSGHLPGALHAPLDGMFMTAIGSYVRPEDPILLLAPPNLTDMLVRLLVRIGLDRVEGLIPPDALQSYAQSGGRLEATEEIAAPAAHERVAGREVFVLDVRTVEEHAHGHIHGATNIPYPRLPLHLQELPRDRPILVHCLGGGRSARAAAYLQRHGYRVANLAGGMNAWRAGGYPVQT